ncbi:MAG: pilus assembly protein [Alphaproteobacteria bacterium]|nr:pilus assembly protein [Alphaproteobacteria bacterium]
MNTPIKAPLFRRFMKDRQGNFAIAFAFTSVAIFLSVGLAVDYSRSIGEKTRVNNALDAASLATARALSISEISEKGTAAEDYFKAIFAANLGIDDLAKSDYKVKNFKINTTDQTVSATADYDQSLTFMRVGSGQTTQVVASKSAASYGIGDIEVAMVLDVTGSMGGSNITSLKAASKLGITELLSANTNTDEHVRISLVPYSDSVNAGSLSKYVYPDYMDAKSNAPAYDTSFVGNVNGAPYDVKTHLESHGASCKLNKKGKMNCKKIPSDFVVKKNGKSQDTCATDRKAPLSGTSYQYTDANPSKGMISRDSRLKKDSCTSSKIVPLSSNKKTLDKAIDALSTGGCTAGHIGLQWAWYTISKNWADYHAAGSKPDDMSTNDKLAKYIILMTDGAFNTAYAGTSSSNVGCGQSTLSKNHTAALCTNIKAAGIKIFTIGFGTSNSADTMLEACASPDEGSLTYSYEPNSANELKETYEHIARLIQSLRLTQ